MSEHTDGARPAQPMGAPAPQLRRDRAMPRSARNRLRLIQARRACGARALVLGSR